MMSLLLWTRWRVALICQRCSVTIKFCQFNCQCLSIFKSIGKRRPRRHSSAQCSCVIQRTLNSLLSLTLSWALVISPALGSPIMATTASSSGRVARWLASFSPGGWLVSSSVTEEKYYKRFVVFQIFWPTGLTTQFSLLHCCGSDCFVMSLGV